MWWSSNFGQLERPGDGLLAVSKEVEAYRYTPSGNQKRSFLFNFLRKPALFAELLDQYASGLPSDATLKDALLERGFLPATATGVLNAFSRSVEFAGYFEPIENSITRYAVGVEHDKIPVRLPGGRRA